MIRLLPPVCRDCGKSADETRLHPYLDFHLCQPCIAAREREVRALDDRTARRRQRPVRDQPKREPPKKEPETKGQAAKGKKRPAKKPAKPT